MITPEIGKMRHRLEIQSPSVTRNSYGEDVQTWSTVATRWGKIEPLAGREVWLAQQVSPDVTHQITLRYYAGLTPAHRLLFDNRTFEIESVRNIDELKRYQQCICKEAV